MYVFRGTARGISEQYLVPAKIRVRENLRKSGGVRRGVEILEEEGVGE